MVLDFLVIMGDRNLAGEKGPAGKHFKREKGPAGKNFKREKGPAGKNFKREKGPAGKNFKRVKGPAGKNFKRVKGPAGKNFKREKGPAGKNFKREKGSVLYWCSSHRPFSTWMQLLSQIKCATPPPPPPVPSIPPLLSSLAFCSVCFRQLYLTSNASFIDSYAIFSMICSDEWWEFFFFFPFVSTVSSNTTGVVCFITKRWLKIVLINDATFYSRMISNSWL